MNSEYRYVGQGCTCVDCSENACCCGADWTDPKIYELQAEIKTLKAENIKAAALLDHAEWLLVETFEEEEKEMLSLTIAAYLNEGAK